MYDDLGYEMYPMEAFQPVGGRLKLYKKGDAPDPPDLRPLADAIRQVGEMQAALGEKQYKFGVQQYETNLPLYQRMVSSSLEGQKLAMDAAREAAADRQMYRPLAESMVADALRYDENRQKDVYAGRAAADYAQAAQSAQDQNLRAMSRFGINPNQARFQAINDEMRLRQAAGLAGSMNNARLAAEQQGFAMKAAALGNGQANTGNMLNAIGTGNNSAASASNLLGQSTNPYWQGSNAYMGALSNQSSALSSSANVMNTSYQNQLAAAKMNADNANAGLSGLGSLAGMALSFSSKSLKERKAAIPHGRALDAVEGMKVEEWQYKPELADGKRHVGPYAEDFQKQTGLGDGKTIDMRDAIGLTMKAVQDLAGEVKALKGGMANGGSIMDRTGAMHQNQSHSGGMLHGPGTGTSDSIRAVNDDNGEPIHLSDGEYVVSADVVRAIGKQTLDKLQKKFHKPVRQAIRRTA